jgi:glucose/arabinose dehydrogenase
MLGRTVLLGLLAAVLIPASAHAGVVATHIGDFDHPTYIVSPPGDTHRVFIVEQTGVVRLIKDGVVQSTPFLDISGDITGPAHYPLDPEQGLLSIAFPPDYATTHRFYAYYTSSTCTDAKGCDNVVAEFDANSDDVADSTPHVLIDMPHPNYVNHNGGQLAFGPDGMLYISTGDGGGANDPAENAQKKTNLLGKILRIHPDASSYTVPAGNPFPGGVDCPNGDGGASTCREIWSYGLRNPWRFSFDSASGDMIIGDVGQANDEEVDLARPGQHVGANWGWPCYEGFEVNAAGPSDQCSPLPASVVNPVLAYHHPSNCSGAPFCGSGIIGGYVMHDPSLPSLEGYYVYGDLSNPRLRVAMLGEPTALSDADLGPQVANLSSFGVDASGHLWAADIEGPVYRIDPAPPSPPPAPARDTTPARLKVTRSRNQHVLRTHYVRITVVPSELATIVARGTVSVPKSARVYRTRSTSHKTRAHKRVTLHLRITKKTLSRIRHALRHRRFLTARITVTSKDAAGNRSKPKHTTVRLVR